MKKIVSTHNNKKIIYETDTHHLWHIQIFPRAKSTRKEHLTRTIKEENYTRLTNNTHGIYNKFQEPRQQ